MIAESTHYEIWVNWETHTASLEPVAGYEVLTYFTQESYQSNIKLLKQSGFRFEEKQRFEDA